MPRQTKENKSKANSGADVNKGPDEVLDPAKQQLQADAIEEAQRQQQEEILKDLRAVLRKNGISGWTKKMTAEELIALLEKNGISSSGEPIENKNEDEDSENDSEGDSEEEPEETPEEAEESLEEAFKDASPDLKDWMRNFTKNYPNATHVIYVTTKEVSRGYTINSVVARKGPTFSSWQWPVPIREVPLWEETGKVSGGDVRMMTPAEMGLERE